MDNNILETLKNLNFTEYEAKAYLALLEDHPPVRARLVALFADSALLAERVIAHPLLLDDLLDTRLETDAPDRAALLRQTQRRLANVAVDDAEARLVVLQEEKNSAMFRVGLAREVEPREPAWAVLGNDVHRRVAEALFQFLRKLQVAGAEHNLRAEVVENVRRAVLAIEFPQLGLVLHHEGEPHAVAADELGGMGKTVDAAQAGKLIQQHEGLHAHGAVLLRCLDRIEVDELIEEQAE